MELLIDTAFNASGILSPDESHHCIKVMRHREGDQVFVTDGNGTLYTCRIVKADARGCQLSVESTEDRPQRHQLHMAVAPTKNIDRFEWFVEKAVEFGVSRITPIVCRHSERTNLRTERLVRLAHAAAKQSLKCTLPQIDEPTAVVEIINQSAAAQRFILHCKDGDKPHLFNAATALGTSTVVLIGPEGDFSDDEIAMAAQNGFTAASLGPERLRTETAALAACHIINLRQEV
ncbi:MAG: 16S rRNA (uracil(1498)-N(3))-methyltransferase [Marinilabiliaceae bacterium]|nr:16S rRNA (uracil(1498)-N(3))-methyltransferase [Marinilabiliaceae bacterium]